MNGVIAIGSIDMPRVGYANCSATPYASYPQLLRSGFRLNGDTISICVNNIHSQHDIPER